MATEYREIRDDEFLAVIRGRPSAPRLFVRVDEAQHYHDTMEEFSRELEARQKEQ